MTKAELVEALYKKFDGEITKKMTADMVDSMFENMTAAIKKEKRFIRGICAEGEFSKSNPRNPLI